MMFRGMSALSTISSLVVLFVTALAGTAAGDDEITGFVAGAGELSGRVTTLDDKPLGGITIHVVSKAGVEKTVVADKDGRFRAATPDSESYVFVNGKVRIAGQVAIAGGDPGSEVVEIRRNESHRRRCRSRSRTARSFPSTARR